MISFLKNIIVFTFIVGSGIFAWNKFMQPELVVNKAWYILALFFVLTAFMHWGYTKAAEKGGQHFTRYFLANTTLKLFFYLLVIVAYIIGKPADAMQFTVCFLVLYLFYTVFETFHLLKHFRNE